MLRAPFLTVRDVANQLQVKEATVRMWIRDRHLRAVKLSKEWRIAVVDLEKFIDEHVNM